jgi:hypothetical protein
MSNLPIYEMLAQAFATTYVFSYGGSPPAYNHRNYQTNTFIRHALRP